MDLSKTVQGPNKFIYTHFIEKIPKDGIHQWLKVCNHIAKGGSGGIDLNNTDNIIMKIDEIVVWKPLRRTIPLYYLKSKKEREKYIRDVQIYERYTEKQWLYAANEIRELLKKDCELLQKVKIEFPSLALIKRYSQEDTKINRYKKDLYNIKQCSITIINIFNTFLKYNNIVESEFLNSITLSSRKLIHKKYNNKLKDIYKLFYLSKIGKVCNFNKSENIERNLIKRNAEYKLIKIYGQFVFDKPISNSTPHISKCSICRDAFPTHIFTSCGHQCICKECIGMLTPSKDNSKITDNKVIYDCPICRVMGTVVRVYLS